MVTLHEVITFLVSMQISISSFRPIMSIDVVEVVIWRESSVSGGSGAVQMFLRWQDRKSGSAGMPRPISYAVFCLKKKKNVIMTNPTPDKGAKIVTTEYRIKEQAFTMR